MINTKPYSFHKSVNNYDIYRNLHDLIYKIY